MMACVHLVRLGCAAMAVGELLAGCATRPAPIVIYESRQESVQLHFDPKAGTGHHHPASISPEQMTTVLKGVRVKNRDVIGGFDLLSDAEGSPAFSNKEILALGPHLSQALKKASPKQIATFYLIEAAPGQGALVTSGGVFVRNTHLYLILANARTSPFSVQYENTFTPDMRDSPLTAIARFKFTVSFSPPDLRIANSQAKEKDLYDGYVDESKMVVLDLTRVMAGAAAPTAP